jgi:hypothetical protein
MVSCSATTMEQTYYIKLQLGHCTHLFIENIDPLVSIFQNMEVSL